MDKGWHLSKSDDNCTRQTSDELEIHVCDYNLRNRIVSLPCLPRLGSRGEEFPERLSME